MKVFMTGATGFICSEVARRLRARGDQVRALVRNPSRADELQKLGCELVAGELSDRAAIRSGIDDCDAVIHGAAMYEIGIPRSRRPAMYEANVQGTENVLTAALELNVKKAVYISTVNAFGNTQGRVVDESHEHSHEYVSYYDETKHLAHQIAKRYITLGLPLVIVQPGGVYGPWDPSPQGNVIKQFLAGKLPVMMFPETGFNLVHRDDVAEGILLALDKGRGGEQYVLGGEISTMGGLIETVARVAGKKAPRATMPGIVLKAASPLGPLVGPMLGFGPNLGEIIKAADGVTYWPRTTRLAMNSAIRPGGWSRAYATP